MCTGGYFASASASRSLPFLRFAMKPLILSSTRKSWLCRGANVTVLPAEARPTRRRLSPRLQRSVSAAVVNLGRRDQLLGGITCPRISPA
jgi:hypothetical protein